MGRRDDSVIASNQAEKGRLMPIHTKIKISIFVCELLYIFLGSQDALEVMGVTHSLSESLTE